MSTFANSVFGDTVQQFMFWLGVALFVFCIVATIMRWLKPHDAMNGKTSLSSEAREQLTNAFKEGRYIIQNTRPDFYDAKKWGDKTLALISLHDGKKLYTTNFDLCHHEDPAEWMKLRNRVLEDMLYYIK